MMGVIWTPVAESDLLDILFYVFVVDLATADRLYHEIRDHWIGMRRRDCPATNIPTRRRIGVTSNTSVGSSSINAMPMELRSCASSTVCATCRAISDVLVWFASASRRPWPDKKFVVVNAIALIRKRDFAHRAHA